MSRALRKRTSRPNYADLAGVGLEEEEEPIAGPSIPAPSTPASKKPRKTAKKAKSTPVVVSPVDLDAGSGDDFVEEQNPEPAEVNAVGSDIEQTQSVSAKKTKKSAPRKIRKSAVGTVTTIGATFDGSQPIMPNLHHRHRALPLFHRDEPVERLISQPKLFQEPVLQLTNSGTSSNFLVGGRVNKSWSCSVGAGPLWELIEDRGWYKESLRHPGETEASRRPKVLNDIQNSNICETLDPEYVFSHFRNSACIQFGRVGSDYLPSYDGRDPSKPITCSLGPFKEQQKLQIEMFTSIAMRECLISFTARKIP